MEPVFAKQTLVLSAGREGGSTAVAANVEGGTTE